MIWRLPAPVRSLYVSNCRRYSSALPKTAANPLRILFCGSDEFSIASLRKLLQAKNDVPGLIESIDVVHRPAKPTGRSLKKLREVPIKKVATEELELPTHIIDTFTGWTPPIQYNLIIAVSFGLFVPPRILNLAEYKGLNVHPSLLPDLHGAAPIHQTIMKRRPFTGLTVQTLHPEKFDGGTILAQSPKPGIECSKETNLAELTTLLADKGGDMLVKVLKTGAFVPPLKDVGWYAQSGGPIEHAEKIEKKHWHIDFSKSTMDEITTIVRAGGVPWTTLENNTRVLLHHIWPTNYTCPENVPTGIWHPDISHVFVNREATPKRSLMARAACGGIMQIKNVTIDGGKANGGYDRFKKLYGKKHVYLWERGQPTPTYGKHKLTPRGMEELNMPPYKPTGGLLNKHIRERKSAG